MTENLRNTGLHNGTFKFSVWENSEYSDSNNRLKHQRVVTNVWKINFPLHCFNEDEVLIQHRTKMDK
ncbi:CLUMA_CG006747, isoform A [Clunio marinus]|uniref:CLUMA_CG006747, isoform A n=1 Tax=Clunio marinus TaxID=568069 RepID=A0A1J1HZ19_9DIPT|nr:CLUMA_CG006747, isoform A [Clunio marinus]